jgi:hypothetical protein
MARTCTRRLRPTGGVFRATSCMFPLSTHPNPYGLTRGRRPLRVRVSDPALADDLGAFLADTVYLSERVGVDTLAVRLPLSLTRDVAVAELEVCLRLWRRRHPAAEVEIVR